MAEEDFAGAECLSSAGDLCSKQPLCVLKCSNIVCIPEEGFGRDLCRQCVYRKHCLSAGFVGIPFSQKCQINLKCEEIYLHEQFSASIIVLYYAETHYLSKILFTCITQFRLILYAHTGCSNPPPSPILVLFFVILCFVADTVS